MTSVCDPIDDLADQMMARLENLPDRLAGQREFLTTYARTTRAVGKALADGVFDDAGWVERWDIAFGELYLTALDAEIAGGMPSRPWQLAFRAPADLPPLRHVLLGMNAHINYDLPQALLAVISDDDFADTRVDGVLARRRVDHENIDGILAGRVAAEEEELATHSARSAVDRVLAPLNRIASRRFLREAREKVWRNTLDLQRARVLGPQEYAVRLAELEVLSAARINDLLAPGQVILRLAVSGFGVLLPPPAAASPVSS